MYACFAEGNTCKCAENGQNVAILGEASLEQPPLLLLFVSTTGVGSNGNSVVGFVNGRLGFQGEDSTLQIRSADQGL